MLYRAVIRFDMKPLTYFVNVTSDATSSRERAEFILNEFAMHPDFIDGWVEQERAEDYWTIVREAIHTKA